MGKSWSVFNFTLVEKLPPQITKTTFLNYWNYIPKLLRNSSAPGNWLALSKSQRQFLYMNETHLCVSEIHASSQLLPGSCVTHMTTSLFCPCAEGGSAGPPGEAAVGRDSWSIPWKVDPALDIPEDLPWESALWAIRLFWWRTWAEGQSLGNSLSGKELGLEEGKCMSHGLLSPRFPALHKPMASYLSDPISPGAHTTLLSHWVLQRCLKILNAWKSWSTSKMLSWKNQSNTEVQN